MPSAKRIVVRVAWGMVTGVFYYIIYLVLLPFLLFLLTLAVGLRGVPIHGEEPTYQAAGILLISLGFVERVLMHPVVAAIRVLSKVVGATVLYILTNGGVFTATISEGASTVTLTADLSILIYALIALSAAAGIVDAGSAVVEYSSAEPD